jgi:hypothetical protein
MSIHVAKLCLKLIFSLSNNTNCGCVVVPELWCELNLKLDALERMLPLHHLSLSNRDSHQLCFCS